MSNYYNALNVINPPPHHSQISSDSSLAGAVPHPQAQHLIGQAPRTHPGGDPGTLNSQHPWEARQYTFSAIPPLGTISFLTGEVLSVLRLSRLEGGEIASNIKDAYSGVLQSYNERMIVLAVDWPKSNPGDTPPSITIRPKAITRGELAVSVAKCLRNYYYNRTKMTTPSLDKLALSAIIHKGGNVWRVEFSSLA